MYNLTNLTGATDFSSVVSFSNEVTGGSFVSMFMIAIFFVSVLVLKKWEFIHALMASSFGCMILSIFLVYGGYLNFMFPLAFLIILALCVLYSYTVR